MASKDTICIQGGWQPKNGEPRMLPIYQSTTYRYETSEEMGALFDLEKDPAQEHPLEDAALEKVMCRKLAETMALCDSPAEQYIRLGLECPGGRT